MPGTAKAPESAAWSSLQKRLLRIGCGYGSVAALTASLLIRVGLPAEGAEPLVFLACAAAIALILCGVAFLALQAQTRPLRAFLAGSDTDRTAAELALVCALNLPWMTVWRVLGLHLPIAIAGFTCTDILTSAAPFRLPDDLWRLAAVWSLLGVTVPTQAFLECFAIQFALQPIIPKIRKRSSDLSPESADRVVTVSVRRKMLFFVVVATLMPLVVLGLTTAVQVSQSLTDLGPAAAQVSLFRVVWWMVLLTVLGTLVTLTMAFLVTRHIGQTTDELVKAMRQVETGAMPPPLEVTSTDEFSFLYDGFNRMTARLQERERLQKALSRFLSPQLAEQAMQKTVCLGGTSVIATVLFADIRGFTSMSERMAAYEVVDLLNGYFAAVEPAIQAAGGWINKFGGDSLLAVFGAPEEQKDHQRRAVSAALAMRAALKEFNAKQTKKGRQTLAIGIGIHCGQLIAGNVGSPMRMEYTVIGDVVNVASRIQSLTKEFGTDILISAAVHQALGGKLNVKELPPAAVPGKAEKIRVFMLHGASAEVEAAT